MRPLHAIQALLVGLAAVTAGCNGVDSAAPAAGNHPDIALASDSTLTPGHVRPGENLGGLLGSLDLGGDQIEAMLASLEGVFDPRRVHQGNAWRIERLDTGQVRLFEYEIDGRSVLRLTPREDMKGEFVAEVVPYHVQVTRVAVDARIDADAPSLFAAMSAAGEQPELSVLLADIFSGEVDFNNDLQPGDRVRLLTERAVRDGRLIGYGAIQAAELDNDGRKLLAFRFQPTGAPPGYYDADGKSLVRFFLRSPLRFDPQITSGFSQGRFHPILHILRAHLGVDYRAPIGAPVVAVAGGVVSFAAWTGGGGRMIRIRHASGYESGYLHLSAFGPGIRVGVHVSQGQLIGKVGMTGLATGPHLHYELRKGGAVVNPEQEHKKMPPGEPIPAAQHAAFVAIRDEAIAHMP